MNEQMDELMKHWQCLNCNVGKVFTIDHFLLKVGRAVDMYLVLVDSKRCRCLSEIGRINLWSGTWREMLAGGLHV